LLSSLINLSLRYRVLVLIVAGAICVYGALAARDLPIDVLPDLTRPTVTVLTEAPGLAPEEVELQVTAPLESAIAGAPGIERLRSTSGIGLSVIHAEFDWNTDIYRARQVVQERIAAVQERLAASSGGGGGVGTPRLAPISSIMGEVMLLGISSDGALSPMQQRDAADWILRPALLSIPGVAQITVQGGEVRQFQVKADPDRLRLYNLTLADLERALADANKSTGGGFIVGPSTELTVRTLGRLRTAEEIAESLVATRETSDTTHAVPVRVRDVARVVEAPSPYKRGEASIGGRPGAILAISKAPGADTQALTRAIDDRLAQLTPALPRGLTINADIFRQSHFIESSIHNVEEALILGAIFVVIILAAFLMNVRTTLISLAALPISILTTFIVFRLLGQSINTMTLGGIAIATGELVDDAVVGVENIFRRLRVGYPGDPSPNWPLSIIARATSEVRGPIFISTLLVLLVFLPLLFLPDLAGRLFTPLAHAYIISIAASMIVSLTVTPALSALLFQSAIRNPKSGTVDAATAISDGPILRLAKSLALRAYALSMPRPRAVVIVCAILFLLSLAAIPFIGAEFLPPFNEGTAVVAITAPPGISLAESDRLGALAEQTLLTIPEVKSVARRTGRAEGDEHALGVNVSEIEVAFFGKDDRKGPPPPMIPPPAINGVEPPFPVAMRLAPRTIRARREVFSEIRDKLSDLPGVSISVGQPIGHRIEHLESGIEAQIVVKIFGPDLSQLRSTAEHARALMAVIPGLADLAIEQQVLLPQVHIRIDPDRAANYGFTTAQLADALQIAVGGKAVSQIIDGPRTIDLVLSFDDPWLIAPDNTSAPSTDSALQALRDIRLLSPSGAVALISDVADIQQRNAPNEIARENALRRIVVSCNVASGHDLGGAATAIQSTLAQNLHAPTGCTFRVEGQFESRQRAVRTIVILGLLSLGIMLALLWTHFKSLALALQVMLNIPFAFIGAIAALLIAHEPFSIASLIGFISLCGIASRNGVLMISHYRAASGTGVPPVSSIRDHIIRASQERVAPVLMTALTSGLALIPILLAHDSPGKEILYPLALTICGGLISCTLLDFFVTPAIYLALAQRTQVNREP
jgi:Cu/Ag efflux pump CusA